MALQEKNQYLDISGYKSGELVDHVLNLLDVETGTSLPEDDPRRLRAFQAVDSILENMSAWASSPDEERSKAFTRLARTVELHRNRANPRQRDGAVAPREWSKAAKSRYPEFLKDYREDILPPRDQILDWGYPARDPSTKNERMIGGYFAPPERNEADFYDYITANEPESAFARGAFDDLVDPSVAGVGEDLASIKAKRLGLSSTFLETPSFTSDVSLNKRSVVYGDKMRVDPNTGRRYVDVPNEYGGVDPVEIPNFKENRTFSVRLADGTETTITASPKMMDSMIESKGSGFWDNTLIGNTYHRFAGKDGTYDAKMWTPYGERNVPYLTGNAAIDYELYGRPEIQRALEELDVERGFAWEAGKTMVGVLEYVGLELGTRGLGGKVAKGLGAVGKGAIARAASSALGASKMGQFAAISGKALARAAAPAAKAIAAPGLRFNMADLAGEVYYNVALQATAGGDINLAGALSDGASEWAVEHVLGGTSRMTRRIAGLALNNKFGREMSERIGIQLAAKGAADTGMFDSGWKAFNALRSEAAEKQLNAVKAGMYGEVGRKLRTEMVAQFADTAFVGYMFGRYSAAAINAAKDGESWDRMDISDKVAYFAGVDAFDPHAMGSMIGMLGGQGTFSAFQMGGVGPFFNSAKLGERSMNEEERHQLNQMAEFQLHMMQAMGGKADAKVVEMMGIAFDMNATLEERAAALEKIASAARQELKSEEPSMAGEIRAGDLGADPSTVSERQLLDLIKRDDGVELLSEAYKGLADAELDRQEQRIRTLQMGTSDAAEKASYGEIRSLIQDERRERMNMRERGVEPPVVEEVDIDPAAGETEDLGLLPIDGFTATEIDSMFVPKIGRILPREGGEASSIKIFAVKLPEGARRTINIVQQKSATGADEYRIDVNNEPLEARFAFTEDGLREAKQVALIAAKVVDGGDPLRIAAGLEPNSDIERIKAGLVPSSYVGRKVAAFINNRNRQTLRNARRLELLDRRGEMRDGKQIVAPGEVMKLIEAIRSDAKLAELEKAAMSRVQAEAELGFKRQQRLARGRQMEAAQSEIGKLITQLVREDRKLAAAQKALGEQLYNPADTAAAAAKTSAPVDTTSAENPPAVSESVESPPTAPVPETMQSIQAQLEMMFEGVSPKNVVFIPDGMQVDEKLPKGVYKVYAKGIGTFITNDPNKSQAMRRDIGAGRMTEERIGEYLYGLAGGKPVDATHVTQVVNANNVVVAEMVTGPSNQAQVMEAANRIARKVGGSVARGDSIRQVSFESSLFERQITGPEGKKIGKFENAWYDFMEKGSGDAGAIIREGEALAGRYELAAKTAASDADRAAFKKKADEYAALTQDVRNKVLEDRPPTEAGSGDRPAQGGEKPDTQVDKPKPEPTRKQLDEKLQALVQKLEADIKDIREKLFVQLQTEAEAAAVEYLRSAKDKLTKSELERARRGAEQRITRLRRKISAINVMANKCVEAVRKSGVVTRVAPQRLQEAQNEIVENLSLVSGFAAMDATQRLYHFLPSVAQYDQSILDAVVQVSRYMRDESKARLNIENKPARNTESSISSKRNAAAKRDKVKKMAETLIAAAAEAGVPEAAQGVADAAATLEKAEIISGSPSFETLASNPDAAIRRAFIGALDLFSSSAKGAGNVGTDETTGKVLDLIQDVMRIRLEIAASGGKDSDYNKRMDAMIQGAVYAAGVRRSSKSKSPNLIAAILGVPVERVMTIAAGVEQYGAAYDARINSVASQIRDNRGRRLISDSQISANLPLLRMIASLPLGVSVEGNVRSGRGGGSGFLKTSELARYGEWWSTTGRKEAVAWYSNALTKAGQSHQVDNIGVMVDAVWESHMKGMRAVASDAGTQVKSPIASLAGMIANNLKLEGGSTASLTTNVNGQTLLELATGMALNLQGEPMDVQVLPESASVFSVGDGGKGTKEEGRRPITDEELKAAQIAAATNEAEAAISDASDDAPKIPKTEEEAKSTSKDEMEQALKEKAEVLWSDISELHNSLNVLLAVAGLNISSSEPIEVTRYLRRLRKMYTQNADGSRTVNDLELDQKLRETYEPDTATDEELEAKIAHAWSRSVELHAKSQELASVTTALMSMSLGHTPEVAFRAQRTTDLVFDALELQSSDVQAESSVDSVMSRAKELGIEQFFKISESPYGMQIDSGYANAFQRTMYVNLCRAIGEANVQGSLVYAKTENDAFGAIGSKGKFAYVGPSGEADADESFVYDTIGGVDVESESSGVKPGRGKVIISKVTGKPKTGVIPDSKYIYMFSGIPITSRDAKTIGRWSVQVAAAMFEFASGYHHRVLSGRLKWTKIIPVATDSIDAPLPYLSPRWWVDRINLQSSERSAARKMSDGELRNAAWRWSRPGANVKSARAQATRNAIAEELKSRLPVEYRHYFKTDPKKTPQDTLTEKAASSIVNLWQRWNIFARGSRGLGTKEVLKSNQKMMSAQLESAASTQLLLNRIQTMLKQLHDWNVSPQDAALLGSMLEAGAVVRFRDRNEFEKALGRPDTAKYYDHLVEWNQLMVEMGKEMVSLGLISSEQFEMMRNHYLPARFAEVAETLGGKDWVLRDSRAEGGTASSAELPRDIGASGDAMRRIFDIRYVMPLSAVRVAKRLETFRILNRLVAEGHVVSPEDYERMGVVERQQYTRVADRGLVRTGEGVLVPKLTKEEEAMLNEGKLSRADADKILEERKNTKLEAAVIQTFIDDEIELRSGGKATMTPAMKKLLNTLQNGHITWHASREIAFLLERNDITAYRSGGALESMTDALQQVTLMWRQLRTVQNPKHWVLQFTTNLSTNSMTGKVPMSDMFESILTGEGVYADAAWEAAEWYAAKKANLPKSQWSEGALNFDSTVLSIGGATLAHMINDPVNGADVLASMFYGADGNPMFRGSGQSSAESDLNLVAQAAYRAGRGWGSFSSRVSKLSSDPNPAVRAEAVRALLGVYNLHEVWWKHAAIIEAKRIGMKHEDAVRWASEGTGDFSDRNTTLLRMTTQFQTGATRLREEGYAKLGYARAGKGKGLDQNWRLIGRQMVQMGAASPFWMYRAAMYPTMARHTMSWRGIAHTALALAMIRLVSQAFGGDDEDLREAAAGSDVLKGTELDPVTLDILRRRHGDAPLPSFGGSSSGKATLAVRDWVEYLQGFGKNFVHAASLGSIGTHSQAGEMLSMSRGPTVGGQSTIIDWKDYVPGVDFVNEVSASLDETNDFMVAEPDPRNGFGMFSMAATATFLDAMKLLQGEKGKSKAQVIAEVAQGVAAEMSAPLGGTSVFGPGFSREMKVALEESAFGSRTFSEMLAGLPSSRMKPTFAEMASAITSRTLLPTSRVSSASRAPKTDGVGRVPLLGNPIYPASESGEEARADIRNRQIEQTILNLLSRTYKESLDMATLPYASRLDAYLNLSRDVIEDANGHLDIRQNPSTELGKWLASKGDTPEMRKLWVAETVNALQSRREVLDTLLSSETGLIYRKDVDPALHDRIVRAAWRGAGDNVQLMRFLYEQMKNTSGNEGILARIWISSGIPNMKSAKGADLEALRLGNAWVAERTNGASVDLDVSFEDQTKVFGPAMYDMAPSTAVQSLPMKGAAAQAARFMKFIR